MAINDKGHCWNFHYCCCCCIAVPLVLATRSRCSEIVAFDPEIERTLHTQRRTVQATNISPPTIESDSEFDYLHNLFASDSELDFAMADNRTLRQLVAPDVNYNGEDPHKHLKEFQGAAKDWIYYLEPNSIASWTALKKVFLERYFSASRAASIRKEICGIRQGNESLTEYWERFKHLVSSCPQHQIIEQLLIQYFYEGLLPMDRNILDTASGGALVDKTSAAAKALIENMSLNSQQFTTRDNFVQSKGVSQIQVSSNKALETRIDELTALVKQLAVAKPQTATLCGICTSPEHPIDTCPILRDESITELPQAYAANLYNQNSQQQNSPQVAAPAPSGPSLEDLVKQMAVNNLQFQQRTDASIQTLNTQMGQLATQINNMQAQGSNQLPAQTVVNLNGPNANVSAISLRSGKVTEPAPEKNKKIIEVPKYAKFLKDLCTSKKRLKGNERVNLGRNTLALIQPKHSPEKATVSSLNQAIPQNCKDPGTFYIPCTIGDTYKFNHSTSEQK
ncbi:uncharacterized protein LOC127101824 [Lathyrus oleraceus]|uniref:uncharacterized protein LOC127101824 n=1 Tax=Pisum sativum TaxID=3888 RepID=UPI0021D1873E|nr:uncharacterized protein LOC127101824 [Pisum sativum]